MSFRPDDLKLFLSARRGHIDSATQIYHAYAPSMLAYARALIREDAIAEDAVQQAFVQVLSLKTKELDQIHNLQAWLIRATRNAALNVIRTQSRAAAREHTYRQLVFQNGSAAPGRDGVISHAELLSAVDTLSDEHREMILLRHVGWLSFDQIAWSLDLKRSTVAARSC